MQHVSQTFTGLHLAGSLLLFRARRHNRRNHVHVGKYLRLAAAMMCRDACSNAAAVPQNTLGALRPSQVIAAAIHPHLWDAPRGATALWKSEFSRRCRVREVFSQSSAAVRQVLHDLLIISVTVGHISRPSEVAKVFKFCA